MQPGQKKSLIFIRCLDGERLVDKLSFTFVSESTGMFSSINTKLTAIITAGTLLTLFCVYLAFMYFHRQNIDLLVRKDLRQAEQLVKEQVRLETDKLGAAMEAILHDQAFAESFTRGDRDALYRQASPLFYRLKSGYGITHMYFHRRDGTVFLRVHKPSLYDDKITRPVFAHARASGTIASGLDLGATAFALRMVAPYYRNGALVGYVELGEEIDSFLNLLRNVTGNEFALVVPKQSVSRQDFNVVLSAQRHVDTWDRMKDYVIISEPVPLFDTTGCLNDDNMSRFMKNPSFDKAFKSGDKLVCGGFPILDANGVEAGALVTLINFSKQSGMLTEMRNTWFVLVLIIFLVTFSMIIVLAKHFIIVPLKAISRAARIFSTGELKEHRISVSSRDEIGMLAESINEMAVQLDQHYTAAIERSVELEQLNRSLESLATTDGLTGLCNHRNFYLKLSEEIARCRRYGHPLTMIMADLDHFKIYNDCHGHLSGDDLLRKLALILLECSRDIDVVARYGGEEFAIILPETTMDDALSCAERIRARVEATPFPHGASQPNGRITVSLGVAQLEADMKDCTEFVEKADQALYRAKERGRNRVET